MMELLMSILNPLLGFLFFIGFFCLLRRYFRCPDQLIPLVASAVIIILLMLGAYVKLLYPVMIMLFIAGGAGCFSELFLLFRKKRGVSRYHAIWGTEPFQIPVSWYIFFTFGVVFFIYSYGEILGGCDTIHHWGIVQKGMMDYNSIVNLPTFYKNYTVGMGVWGYFINHLVFGAKFRQDACMFAWLLLYIAAFSVIWNPAWNKRIVLKNIFCSILFLCFLSVGTSRMHDYYLSAWIVLWPIGVLLAGIVSSFEIKGKQGAIGALKTIFLVLCVFYCCCSSKVCIFDVLVDLLFPVIAGCVLFFYLSNPKLKSFFWISPVLGILFLIKRPGLFLSILVIILCMLDQAVQHRIWKFFIPQNFTLYKRRILWSLAGIIFAGLMVASMPIFWGIHCHHYEYTSKFKTTSYSKDKIYAVLAENTTKRISVIRDRFQSNFMKHPVIFHEQSPWYSLWVRYTNAGEKKTSTGWSLYQIMVLSVIAFAIMMIFCIFRKQYKTAIRLSLLAIVILASCVLYLFGLLYTYVYSFVGDEGLRCVAFERYVVPILCLWYFFLLYVFSQLEVSSNENIEILFRACLVVITIIGVDTLRYNGSKLLVIKHSSQHAAMHQQARKMMTSVWPAGKKFENKKILMFWNGKNPPINYLGDVPFFFNLNSNYGNAKITVIYRHQYKSFCKRLKNFDYVLWYVNESVNGKDYFDIVRKECPELFALPSFPGNNKCCIWENKSDGFELISQGEIN